jgi:hypothetical protein
MFLGDSSIIIFFIDLKGSPVVVFAAQLVMM